MVVLEYEDKNNKSESLERALLILKSMIALYDAKLITFMKSCTVRYLRYSVTPYESLLRYAMRIVQPCISILILADCTQIGHRVSVEACRYITHRTIVAAC